MSDSVRYSSVIPLIADTLPRVVIVPVTGAAEGAPIHCRRVVTLLGSRPGCKVLLKHKSVAPIQVALVHDGGSMFALNLGDHCTTKLNDLELQQEKLADADVLSIGPWRFTVHIQNHRRFPDADLHVGDIGATPTEFALEHLRSGKILSPKRRICIVGRREDCDVAISDNSVSRSHAVLFFYMGRPVVVDLLSENRTRVNGRPVLFAALSHGDELTFGETRFKTHMIETGAVKRASNNGVKIGPPLETIPDPPPKDLINIRATEAKVRWRIVDSFERSKRKK